VLRVQAAHKISSLPAGYRGLADREIVANLLALPETRGARQVLAYLPLPDEPSLRALLEQVVQRAVPVFVPRVESPTEMSFVRWRPSDGYEVASGGLWSGVSNEVPTAASTVAFIPGRAFDLDGFRLGRGRGYYDRVLVDLRQFATLVGVAYECQLLGHVPREPHDQIVDIVVTEMRTVRVRALS
jgi:5-formyltetrahydrofolate cyclo-ligase